MKLYIGKIDGANDWIDQFKVQSDGLKYDFVEDETLKAQCDFYLYIMTPKTKGIKTVMNAVNDSNLEPRKTIFSVINDGNGFNEHAFKSLVATGKMITRNGGSWFENLEQTIKFISGN